MGDLHLNLFHSYGACDRKGNLNENNLTRAFIQTLLMLSGDTRTRLLHLLDKRFSGYDFAGAEFALQQPVENACDCLDKCVVTIATRTIDFEGQESPDKGRGSVPDAWVFDKEQFKYCLLIECKRAGNELDEEQVFNHARVHFHMDKTEAKKHIVPLEWYNVLEAVDRVVTDDPLESRVLSSLTEFLGFYDYWLFSGFRFSEVDARQPPYSWRLFNGLTGVLRFRKLQQPPDWRLFSASKEEKK